MHIRTHSLISDRSFSNAWASRKQDGLINHWTPPLLTGQSTAIGVTEVPLLQWASTITKRRHQASSQCSSRQALPLRACTFFLFSSQRWAPRETVILKLPSVLGTV